MKKIKLFDINKKLCQEWMKQFKDYEDVQIINCTFEELESEKVVTAGNSYGLMSGGIDLSVRNYYGQQIQDIIQSIIICEKGGYLPLGESIEILTNDKLKPVLIYAPTMETPKQINPEDVFYIFTKLLKKYNNFACCGLGTLTGRISEKECAKQMKLAYEYVNKYLEEE